VDTVPSAGHHSWELDGPNGAHATLHHMPRMVTDDLIALRAAAVHGVAITQLPSMVVIDQLKSGELEELLPGWSPKLGVVHAVYPSRRGMLPAVRTLIDFLAERMREAGD